MVGSSRLRVLTKTPQNSTWIHRIAKGVGTVNQSCSGESEEARKICSMTVNWMPLHYKSPRSLCCALLVAKAMRQRIAASGILQVVDLEETNTALAVSFVNQRGVGAGGEHRDDGGFEVVGGRERRFFDLDLRAVFPVIVFNDERPIAIAQFEGGVGHGVVNAERGQRWRNRSD